MRYGEASAAESREKAALFMARLKPCPDAAEENQNTETDSRAEACLWQACAT